MLNTLNGPLAVSHRCFRASTTLLTMAVLMFFGALLCLLPFATCDWLIGLNIHSEIATPLNVIEIGFHLSGASKLFGKSNFRENYPSKFNYYCKFQRKLTHFANCKNTYDWLSHKLWVIIFRCPPERPDTWSGPSVDVFPRPLLPPSLREMSFSLCFGLEKRSISTKITLTKCFRLVHFDPGCP